MNDISKGRSTRTASRISRGVGAAALSAVLIAGMAGCMTGKLASTAPVHKNAVAPAGVDLSVPADRIEQQLARQAAVNRANSERFAGRTADRVAEELARQSGTAPVTREAATTNPHPGMTADHLDRLARNAQ